jgi:hypothetical protein
MGGCVRPARPRFSAWDYRMDYTEQAGRAAARHVLECCDPVLIPIEVTVQTALRRAFCQRSARRGRWAG